MFEYLSITLLFYLILFFSGFGISLLLKDIFKLDSFVKTVVYSMICGLTFNVFFLLLPGMLGFEILGSYYPILIIVQITFNFVLVFVLLKTNRIDFSEMLSCSKKTDPLDKLFFLSLFLLLVVQVIINSKVYIFASDDLRFWLNDARLIYEGGFLRDNSHIINNNRYSSFVPLLYSQLYYFYGRVVEQYISVIPILFLSLASFLVYFKSITLPKFARLFTFLSIILANAIFMQYVFTAYADIEIAFFVLFATLMICTEVPEKHYPKKIFLVLMSLITLAFIKLPEFFYSPYSVFLFIIWIVYDWSILRKNIRSKGSVRWRNLVLVFSPFLILLVNSYYRLRIIPLDETYDLSSVGISLQSNRGFLDLIKFPVELYVSLSEQNIALIYFFSVLWVVGLILIVRNWFMRGERKVEFDKFTLYYVVIILLPFFNIIFYGIHGRTSQLERYITASLFVGVLLYVEIFVKVNKKYLQYLLLVFISTLTIIQFFQIYKGEEIVYSVKGGGILSVTGGELENYNAISEEYSIISDLKQKVGKSKMLIGSYGGENSNININMISNMDNELNIFKYYFISNQTAEYYLLRVEEFVDKACLNDVEYFFIANADGFAKFHGIQISQDQYYQLYKVDCDLDEYKFIEGYEKTSGIESLN